MSDIQDDQRPMTIAELGELDVTDVEAVRFITLPVGGYRFRVIEATLDSRTLNDKKTGEPSEVPVVEVKMQVVAVHGLVGIPEGYSEDDFIDKTHTERQYLRDAESLGRLMALGEDIGWTKPPGQRVTMQNMLHSWIGIEFDCRGKHRRNPQDPTQVFFGLDFDKKKSAAARKI